MEQEAQANVGEIFTEEVVDQLKVSFSNNDSSDVEKQEQEGEGQISLRKPKEIKHVGKISKEINLNPNIIETNEQQ